MATDTMTTRHYFVEPQDVLMLRGNRSFGEAGEHGEALLPPWPSLFAGAFRSAMLAGDARRLAEFGAIGGARPDRFTGEDQRSERMRGVLGDALFTALGTPQRPGGFRITWASLAICDPSGVTPAVPLPADVVAIDDHGQTRLKLLQPAALPAGVRASCALPMTALLQTSRQVKPAAGHWLNGAGLSLHLQGRGPTATLRTKALYERETRLGIALDATSRTADDGALYTTEAISFNRDSGFLVGIAGAAALPDTGTLRLGGDGRSASWRRVPFTPPAAPAIAPRGRFRLLLTTPGIFSGGWLPEGTRRDEGGLYRLHGQGFSARLACAAVPRHDVVSGWDLAQWAPKTAQRVAGAGSVYWFDQFEGDAGKLAAWLSHGLWPDNAQTPPFDAQRRAEGFNNALLGHWL